MLRLNKDFAQHLADQLDLPIAQTEPLISENLLSPFTVELPKSCLEQAKDFVRFVFQIRQNSHYQRSILSQNSSLWPQASNHNSICMSYDFHWIPEEAKLKLIEINTNAAFLLLGALFYEMLQQPHPVSGFSLNTIKDMILMDHHLNTGGDDLNTIVITDDQPEQQRLYVEFLAYQALFKKWGFDCAIQDAGQITESVDFVYNRSTDFYLKESSHATLKQLALGNKTTVSPHPFEYLLLADKQRLETWSTDDFKNWLLQNWDQDQVSLFYSLLPQTQKLHQDNAEQIWSERKKLFFKPQSSFGAKQSYRGATVSRKNFETLLNGEFIVQEYVPAPESEFSNGPHKAKLKYDLRFYVYRDQVQSVMARLYEGQVTNLRTPLGGFAPVKFI